MNLIHRRGKIKCFQTEQKWYMGIQSSQYPQQEHTKILMPSTVLQWTQWLSLGHSGTSSLSACPPWLPECSVRINELVEGWVMDYSIATESLLDPTPLLNSHKRLLKKPSVSKFDFIYADIQTDQDHTFKWEKIQFASIIPTCRSTYQERYCTFYPKLPTKFLYLPIHTRIKPLTFWLVDDLYYLLSHSHPYSYECYIIPWVEGTYS